MTYSYDVDTYKFSHSDSFKGFGDGLSPKQTTLDGYLSLMSKNNITQATGDICNVGFKIATYDSSKKTGTISFADMSKFKNCDTVYSNSNLDKANYSESKNFVVKTVAGQNLILFQLLLFYAKNNNYPDLQQSTALFLAEYKGMIMDGMYFAPGSIVTIDINGNQKVGNKNLLDTYLKATNLPAYPY